MYTCQYVSTVYIVFVEKTNLPKKKNVKHV